MNNAKDGWYATMILNNPLHSSENTYYEAWHGRSRPRKAEGANTYPRKQIPHEHNSPKRKSKSKVKF